MARGPKFPLYIPSKGRSQYMMTSRALSALGVPHFIVVEPQQIDDYRKAVSDLGLLTTVLELDLGFKDRYELLDEHGLTKSTGPGPARNFAWEHSIANGHPWHWVMDDNIADFRRFNRNEKVKVSDGAIFAAMEDFALRYRNLAMCGPNYYMFAPARQKIAPFVMNTRIYSCNLIRNDCKRRWRGRYNEDTILSIDLLRDGWCTVQFNAFLQRKMPTQVMGGGNSAEFYFKEGTLKPGAKYADNGTLAKSEMLVREYPQYARLVWKFGRVHHHVDYRPFKNTRLLLRPGVEIRPGVDEYGMELMVNKSEEVRDAD